MRLRMKRTPNTRNSDPLYESQNTGGVEDYICFRSQNIAVMSQQADGLVISVPWSHQSDENAAVGLRFQADPAG